jgi:hypothetical protein
MCVSILIHLDLLIVYILFIRLKISLCLFSLHNEMILNFFFAVVSEEESEQQQQLNIAVVREERENK